MTQAVGNYANDFHIKVQCAQVGFATGNYAITYDAGDLTIDQRAITLSAADQSKIYDVFVSVCLLPRFE